MRDVKCSSASYVRTPLNEAPIKSRYAPYSRDGFVKNIRAPTFIDMRLYIYYTYTYITYIRLWESHRLRQFADLRNWHAEAAAPRLRETNFAEKFSRRAFIKNDGEYTV